MTLDRVTGGPAVNESLETNVPGIFACGNVLHVHDLVDYVSEEAARAGRAAAKYVRGGTPKSARVVKLTGRDGVRYTVPQTVRPAAMGESVVVRFRVANPYYGKYISPAMWTASAFPTAKSRSWRPARWSRSRSRAKPSARVRRKSYSVWRRSKSWT